MKIFSSLVLIFCALSIGYAQEVHVSSTEEYTNQLEEGYWKRVLGQDETGFYLLRQFGPISSETIMLEKYSPSLKLLYATNIQATSGTINDSKLHRFTEMSNGKVYVFLEGWNKVQQQNSFLVHEVLDDGTISKDYVILETEPATSLSKAAHYSISFSPDGSKLLVLTEKPYVKGAKETLRLQVFNVTDFSSLWSQELTLENDVEKGPVNDIIVNDSGVAYVFKDIRISDKLHNYQLMTVDKDQYKIAVVDLKGYAPCQKKMLIDPKGNILIGGMLGPYDFRSTDWQATWYFQADELGQILQNKVAPLGEELLSFLVSAKDAAKENFKLKNYFLKDILLKTNGEILMLTEYIMEDSKPISIASLVYEYSLNNGNAVILSFTADGNRGWNRILEKNQIDQTTDPKQSFNSYAYQLLEDKLYLVWNYTDIKSDPPFYKYRYWLDNNKNKINIDNLFGKEAIYPTMLTVLDNEGNFSYEDRTFKSLPLHAIQQPNAFAMAVDPNVFFPTKKGMIILSHMRGMKAKRFKFSTITY